MNLAEIETFLTIVNTKSITRTADLLLRLLRLVSFILILTLVFGSHTDLYLFIIITFSLKFIKFYGCRFFYTFF